MKKLLIVANMPSANTRLLADAVLRGANHPDVEGVTPVLKSPLEAAAEDVLSSDGIIIGTTENFAYMSGLIKDFFERILPLPGGEAGFAVCLVHSRRQ